MTNLKLCEFEDPKENLLNLWTFSEFSLLYKKPPNSDITKNNATFIPLNYIDHFIKNQNLFLSDNYKSKRDAEIAFLTKCNFYRSAILNLSEEIRAGENDGNDDIYTMIKAEKAEIKNIGTDDILDYINRSLYFLSDKNVFATEKKPLAELTKEVTSLTIKVVKLMDFGCFREEKVLKSDFLQVLKNLREIAFDGLKGHCFGTKMCFVEVLELVENILPSFGCDGGEREFFGKVFIWINVIYFFKYNKLKIM